MILFMALARRGVHILRKLSGIGFFALLVVQALAAFEWDSKGAAQAFEEARQKQNQLSQMTNPAIGNYLECAKAYRKVYVLDPHYKSAGEAIYSEGRIYHEMGDRFSNLEYYLLAVKRFNLLVEDYRGNQSCKDALLRMASICSKNLKDESAAQDAYAHLKTRYKYEVPFAQTEHKDVLSKSASLKENKPSYNPDKTEAPATPSVQNIRYWSASDQTRIIIDMSLEAEYQAERLAKPDRIYFDIANAVTSMDLQNRTIEVNDYLLKKIRIRQNGPDTVRVVFDVSEAGAYTVSELHNPFRIVINLQRSLKSRNFEQTSASGSNAANTKTAESAANPSSRRSIAPGKISGIKVSLPPQVPAGKEQRPPLNNAASTPATSAAQIAPNQKDSGSNTISIAAGSPEGHQKAAASGRIEAASKNSVQISTDIGLKLTPPSTSEMVAPPKSASKTSSGDRTLTRMLGLKVGRIVIDPGHGGHDLGTVGPEGLLEKNLVLSIAQDLQKQLQDKLGAQVVLTRTDDRFVSLEERTAIANQHRADLFISIHANSSRVRSISGVETYYLDFANSEAEKEVAARENAIAENNVRDLEDLIKKIAQAEKSAESRELASIVQKRLYSESRKFSPRTNNRGVRSAPFIVLIGANMPSVLAEVAFLSNPKDEKLLKKKTNRELLVNALFSGIENYMKTLGSAIAHNQSTLSK
jgi:N-acetylmuramoyl-L-alanine amidase